MRKPEVSIIMATYNRSHLIENSLKCIRNQSHKDWECIIIDDGSTDNTSTVVNLFIKEDARFKYFARTNDHEKGLSGCRNKGLDLASGDYVIFFDDDDLVHPRNLEVNLDYLKGLRKDFCNYQKKPFFEQEPEIPKLLKGNDPQAYTAAHLDQFITGERAMASCTVMWSKKCFENIRFNEDLHYAEEWECYSRILMAGFDGITIDEILYFNRKHPGSNTGRFDSGGLQEKESMSRAAGLMIENISEANCLTPDLEKYFIRLGFKLKDYRLIEKLFSYTQPGLIGRLKYWSGFHIYPILRPIFKVKAKLVQS